MEFTDTDLARAKVIEIKGRIDAESTGEFETHCKEWIDLGFNLLVLDMTEVGYLSSAGLCSLLNLGKRVKPMGGKIVIVSKEGPVRQLLQISGFDAMFPVCRTVEEAAGHVI